MSQKTYQRSKLLIQVNDVAKIESLWSWIVSLTKAKSLFIIIFWHKIFVFWFSKLLLHIIMCQILLRKYFASLQIKYKLSPKIHSQEPRSRHQFPHVLWETEVSSATLQTMSFQFNLHFQWLSVEQKVPWRAVSYTSLQGHKDQSHKDSFIISAYDLNNMPTIWPLSVLSTFWLVWSPDSKTKSVGQLRSTFCSFLKELTLANIVPCILLGYSVA